MRYSIFDPTGNITALVESAVPVSEQPEAAAAILRRHPEVEQVGFVRLSEQPELRMAGGEFCGNATMSAAALWQMRYAPDEAESSVSLRVSGVEAPIPVYLKRAPGDGFAARVRMPEAVSVTQTAFTFSDVRAALPLVRLHGISHIVITPDNPLFQLLRDRHSAEQAVRRWCAERKADGLGLMFLEPGETDARLTPLVYVPQIDTLFWENACASGSSAVGMALACRTGRSVRLALRQPGGTLRVVSDPDGETCIFGTTRRTGEESL